MFPFGWLFVWLFCASVIPAAAGPTDDPDQLRPAVVGVGIDRDGVLLATLALVERRAPFMKRTPAWRFRRVAMQAGDRIDAAELARDGTLLRVLLRGGVTRLIDLTETAVVYRSSRRSSVAPAKFEPAPAASAPANVSELHEDAKEFLQMNGFAERAELRVLEFDWHFVSTAPPDVRRYAPLFLLQAAEQVTPTSFDVWDEMASSRPAGMSKTAFERRLFREYERRDPPCRIYTRLQSFPGSWLAQYWLYYPFDRGLNGHLHDSEHIFVEIDKLGGAVRRVAAAGHGNWAPNSIYETYSFDAPPVQLPLQALVELGKHATAPDINRDGFFTPGVDANAYWDSTKVWGVRDNTGNTDSSYRAFENAMAVPRFQAHRALAVSGYEDHWAQRGDVSAQQVTRCSIATIHARRAERVRKCKAPTSECAETQVRGHPDFRKPAAILKPGIYPRHFLRLGFSLLPGPEGPDSTWFDKQRRSAYLGFGTELQFPRLRVPGRLYGEAFFRESSRTLDGLAFTYERLASNLFGYYLGLSWYRDLSPDPADDFQKGMWLTFGGLFERPLPVSRLNFSSRFGFAFDNYFGLAWEARAGVAVTFGARSRRFGIRASDPSPY